VCRCNEGLLRDAAILSWLFDDIVDAPTGVEFWFVVL
jgi:hypothetical protein